MTRTNFLRFGAFAITCVCGSLAAIQAKADPMAYVATADNELGTLDLNTGAFTNIGALALPPGAHLAGLGFGGPNLTLYGIDSGVGGASTLYSINTSTADMTPVGTLSANATGGGLDAAGKFFIISQDANAVFYTLTPAAPPVGVVGQTGEQSSGLEAIDPSGTTLYTSSNAGSELDSVNLATGQLTQIGALSDAIDGGFFVGPQLYGITPSSQIVPINTLNGSEGQPVPVTDNIPGGANGGTENVDPIVAGTDPPAPEPVPEPTSFAVLATAIVSFGLLRRRLRG